MRPVPHLPLLWVAFLVGIPAITLLVYDQGLVRFIAAAVLVLAFLVSGFDWFISRHKLSLISCETPELIRGTTGREMEVPLTFSNIGPNLEKLRYGIPVSRFFRVENEVERSLSNFDSGKQISVKSLQTPLKRGHYQSANIFIQTPSKFGLWLIRRELVLESEIRVYPDLSIERKRLASIFLMRGHDGSHLVRQVGKGRDFEQLREYQPGDDYVDIDWKATARRQMPVTRTYQIEKTQEVYVVVDNSRLSGREIRVPVSEETGADWRYSEGSSGGEQMITTQLEKFLHCSLILASVAEKQGDCFGFVSFSDKVDQFIRAKSGKGHYNVIRDALYTLEPEPVAPDFEPLMIALRQKLTRRALIVMLIDLSDPLTAEHFFEALPLINRRHLVLVNMVRPVRARELFSNQRGPGTVSEIYEELGGHFQWQELKELSNQLRHLGVELGLPDHEELCTEAVTQYLNVKNRQLI
ncbi:MAG: DUF58 domain-containing protein [Verrucomicrobiales bacterium]|nr:DUF58 domain-containing protein [Verrucomicrobiales bacterium]